jgi:hypothetical protein
MGHVKDRNLHARLPYHPHQHQRSHKLPAYAEETVTGPHLADLG